MPRAPSEWFRNKRWSTEIEQSFFTRLARSRTQRDQNLVIQAVELVDSRHDVALRLIEVYFESRTEPFHDSRAWNAKASALQRLGEIEASVEAYRSTLEVEASQPGVQTGARVEYPYLVALHQIKKHYSHALETAEANSNDIAFPINRFKLCAARAIILGSLGRLALAKAAAEEALRAADETQSEFRHHRQLGLVRDDHKDAMSQLRRIASA